MTTILVPLGRGGRLFACVDEIDAIVLSTTWNLDDNNGRLYARRILKNPPAQFRLHRVIARRMGLDLSRDIDHVNGFGLDCRRSNLRSATRGQNLLNRGPNVGTRSGFKGVSWDEQTGKWRAHTKFEGKRYSLGRHDDPRDAALAYDDFARAHHGAFARLNFPVD